MDGMLEKQIRNTHRMYQEMIIYQKLIELTNATTEVANIMECIQKKLTPLLSERNKGNPQKKFQKFWEEAHRNSQGFMALVSNIVYEALGEEWDKFLQEMEHKEHQPIIPVVGEKEEEDPNAYLLNQFKL